MAKWSFNVATWTPAATADTIALTNQNYMALQGGSGTQLINALEVAVTGMAGASSPTLMVFARDSTVGASTSALTTNEKNAALNPATAALGAPQVPFTQATTPPKRSSTLGLLTLGINAFGGIFRWTWAPGEEIGILGNTASLGEVSLSAYTGGTVGLVQSHIIYEPY